MGLISCCNRSLAVTIWPPTTYKVCHSSPICIDWMWYEYQEGEGPLSLYTTAMSKCKSNYQPLCYRGNVTKITQMVPECSPQRGNPWKGFGPRGFLYSFLMVYCNTHSHSSCKNVTPTHTKFVHKVTFFTREVTFLMVLILPGLKDYRHC
jgi:hypothetical protein